MQSCFYYRHKQNSLLPIAWTSNPRKLVTRHILQLKKKMVKPLLALSLRLTDFRDDRHVVVATVVDSLRLRVIHFKEQQNVRVLVKGRQRGETWVWRYTLQEHVPRILALRDVLDVLVQVGFHVQRRRSTGLVRSNAKRPCSQLFHWVFLDSYKYWISLIKVLGTECIASQRLHKNCVVPTIPLSSVWYIDTIW